MAVNCLKVLSGIFNEFIKVPLGSSFMKAMTISRPYDMQIGEA